MAKTVSRKRTTPAKSADRRPAIRRAAERAGVVHLQPSPLSLEQHAEVLGVSPEALRQTGRRRLTADTAIGLVAQSVAPSCNELEDSGAFSAHALMASALVQASSEIEFIALALGVEGSDATDPLVGIARRLDALYTLFDREMTVSWLESVDAAQGSEAAE